MEKRELPAELRSDGRRLTGYAAVFDSETMFGGVREVIRPGAFQASLSQRGDILALADHDPSKVLGRTRSKTLRLKEDDIGLWFSLDLPNTRVGMDVMELTRRGDIGGMSFGFDILAEGDNPELREIVKVELYEISVVSAFPAYAATTAELRAKSHLPPKLATRERLLRIWGDK